MLALLSPAKTLDFESPLGTVRSTQPRLMGEAEVLVARLRDLDLPAMARLLGISEALAALTVGRVAAWRRTHKPGSARPAILAFAGDVYEGLEASSLGEEDLAWAQDHLRILSGLYGVLRPLDLIRPYRLEMGTRLATDRGRDLYAFWGDRLRENLEAVLGLPRIVVNLASEEYARAARLDRLGARVITPIFQDLQRGTYRVLSFHAKRARGLMARFLVQGRLRRPEELQAFGEAGYVFDPKASQGDAWVFRR